MTSVGPLSSLGPHELAPGVRMYPIIGEGAMLNVVELDPGSIVPLHSHPHEQLGLVLAGFVTMTIDGVAHPCGPDATYVIPGGVEHGAVAGPQGCRVIDVFQPVREDYRALVQA